MPDSNETTSGTVDHRGAADVNVDDSSQRQRVTSEYGGGSTRQLLSETLRLRRAAQLQRAAADQTSTTSLTQTTSSSGGLRRPASSDAAGTTSSKRRKRVRGASTQPRARRIMFHEYKGPPDDDVEATPAGSRSSPSMQHPQQSSTSVCLISPRPMTTTNAFSPHNLVCRDFKINEQTCDRGSSLQSFGGPLTADFTSFCRPTSSSSSSLLPRFAELQRSLCATDAAASANHLALMHGHHSIAPAVSCPSFPASDVQRSSFVDAVFYRPGVTTTSTTTLPSVATPSSSSSSSSVSLLSSHVTTPCSQHSHPQSMTSPMNVTSGLLTSGGLDHVITCFPSVTAAYRPNIGKGNHAPSFFVHLFILCAASVTAAHGDFTTGQ